MNRRAGAGFLLPSMVLAGGLAGGCSSATPGRAVLTGGTISDSAEPSSTSSPPPSMAPRPRVVRLDGRDPCVLVPRSDWPKFYIERPGRFKAEERAFHSPDCFYSNDAGSFSVTLVVTEGVGKWTDGSRSGITERMAPIEGFPAISITPRIDEYQCGVAVDVADGQYLLATVAVRESTKSRLPERCAYAYQLAESAMHTLVGGV